MTPDRLNALIVFGPPAAMAALGFIGGMLGARYRLAPWIATAAMIACYLAFLAVLGTWAADCPGCYRGEATRGQLARIAPVIGFIATLILVLIVWLGRLLTYEIFLWRQRA